MNAAPMIAVSGFGRCGSSMLMQMLHAGGVPCTGRAPAFEDNAVVYAVTPEYVAEHAGHAVKVLDPQRVGLPGNVRVIWMDRDVNEQARSLIKFTELLHGVRYSRDARRSLPASLRRDRIAAMRVIGQRPLMAMRFESVLRMPISAACRLRDFVAPLQFDPLAAAAQVRQRDSECAPGLDLELSLMSGVA